ncbi:hypothetical protein BV898_19642, partial [Hypsibius exemplaris]
PSIGSEGCDVFSPRRITDVRPPHLSPTGQQFIETVIDFDHSPTDCEPTRRVVNNDLDPIRNPTPVINSRVTRSKGQHLPSAAEQARQSSANKKQQRRQRQSNDHRMSQEADAPKDDGRGREDNNREGKVNASQSDKRPDQRVKNDGKDHESVVDEDEDDGKDHESVVDEDEDDTVNMTMHDLTTLFKAVQVKNQKTVSLRDLPKFFAALHEDANDFILRFERCGYLHKRNDDYIRHMYLAVDGNALHWHNNHKHITNWDVLKKLFLRTFAKAESITTSSEPE